VAEWRVLCLSGSLRRRSGNTALLLAARQLAPNTLALDMYDGLGQLPLFNPDDEVDPLPASVQALRAAVGTSDALLIACPEYAHGIPGAFKNLLDWLVGSLEFPGKPDLVGVVAGFVLRDDSIAGRRLRGRKHPGQRLVLQGLA